MYPFGDICDGASGVSPYGTNSLWNREDDARYIHVCKFFDLGAVKDVPDSLSVRRPKGGF